MRKRQWCASHYAQWHRYGEVKPFAFKWADVGAACVVCGSTVEQGTGRRKHCSRACQAADSRTGGERPTESVCDFCGERFSLGRARTGRLQRADTKWCPDCGRSSPEVQRFRRYGITRERYAAALAAGCEICGSTVETLHVDHDHSCCPTPGGHGKATCGECVRGLLCGPCNRGIGLFFDNADALDRASQYLRRRQPK